MEKNTKYIIGGVLIVIGLVVWNNRKKANQQPNNGSSNLPNTNNDILLTFGNGGGFTGIETSYNVMSNGDVIRKGGVLLKVGTLDNATIDKIKSFIGQYKDFKYSKPDNMYGFIDINNNHIVWGFTPPNNDISNMYNTLNSYTKE
jgi:hypothetical protein